LRKYLQFICEKGRVIDPVTPFLAPNEKVASLSDSDETQHSDAMDWISGAEQDSQSIDFASSQSVNRRNDCSDVQSSYEQFTYSNLVEEFGVEQANQVATALGWNIKFFE
jgi:hypothetical protein